MSHLIVSIARQTVQLLDGDAVVWQAPVSTSQFGTGEVPGSFRTPLGKFHIDEKIGGGAPWGAVFKARVPTGDVWQPGMAVESDLILTRILWLAGDEPHNLNTKNRYIYFHGTNHEEKIGTPASHGCIRLRNDDMLALHDLVPAGIPVEIKED